MVCHAGNESKSTDISKKLMTTKLDTDSKKRKNNVSGDKTEKKRFKSSLTSKVKDNNDEKKNDNETQNNSAEGSLNKNSLDGSLDKFDICNRTKDILVNKNYTKLFPIQVLCFKAAFKGDDVVGVARTGCGKTLAFTLPLIERMFKFWPRDSAPAATKTKGFVKAPMGTPNLKILAVLPTRELAVQVHEVVEQLNDGRYRSACIYGGAAEAQQITFLREGAEVVVCTPGRITDFFDRKIVSFQSLMSIVLDEADKLLEMGFRQNIEDILHRIREQREEAMKAASLEKCEKSDSTIKKPYQLLLFTATFAKWSRDIARNYMSSDQVVIDGGRLTAGSDQLSASNSSFGNSGEDGSKNQTLIQHLAVQCHWSARVQALPSLIALYSARAAALESANKSDLCKSAQKSEPNLVIIFCETKQEVNEVALNSAISTNACALHGDVPQQQRESVIKAFRSGKLKYLVATDVAARGLDISGVRLVIQMAPPRDVDTYIHRAGRTGRAGRRGVAMLFYAKTDAQFLAKIEKYSVSLGNPFKFIRVGLPQADMVKKALLIKQLVKLFPSAALDSLTEFETTEVENDLIIASKTKKLLIGADMKSQSILERIAGCLLEGQKPENIVVKLLRYLFNQQLSSSENAYSCGKDQSNKGKNESGERECGDSDSPSLLSGREGLAAFHLSFNRPPIPPLQGSAGYVWKALKRMCVGELADVANAVVDKIEQMTLTDDGCGAVFDIPSNKIGDFERSVMASAASNKVVIKQICDDLPPLQDALYLARQELAAEKSFNSNTGCFSSANRLNPNHVSVKKRGGAEGSKWGNGRKGYEGGNSSRGGRFGDANGFRRGRVRMN